jgi:hypothetical protein
VRASGAKVIPFGPICRGGAVSLHDKDCRMLSVSSRAGETSSFDLSIGRRVELPRPSLSAGPCDARANVELLGSAHGPRREFL